MTILAACGCVSSGAVPRADAAMAERSREDLRTLAQGRRVYVTSCTGCHALYRVDGRDAEGWRHAVATMAPKAKLTPDDRDALLSYLRAAILRVASR